MTTQLPGGYKESDHMWQIPREMSSASALSTLTQAGSWLAFFSAIQSSQVKTSFFSPLSVKNNTQLSLLGFLAFF